MFTDCVCDHSEEEHAANVHECLEDECECLGYERDTSDDDPEYEE